MKHWLLLCALITITGAKSIQSLNIPEKDGNEDANSSPPLILVKSHIDLSEDDVSSPSFRKEHLYHCIRVSLESDDPNIDNVYNATVKKLVINDIDLNHLYVCFGEYSQLLLESDNMNSTMLDLQLDNIAASLLESSNEEFLHLDRHPLALVQKSNINQERRHHHHHYHHHYHHYEQPIYIGYPPGNGGGSSSSSSAAGTIGTDQYNPGTGGIPGHIIIDLDGEAIEVDSGTEVMKKK